MTDSPQRRAGIAYWLTVIGKWWVGLIVLFFVLGTAVALAVALYRFIKGNPEWEGIVMVPEVLVFVVLLCLPGAALLGIGRLLSR
jgi:hypothetical protein